MRGILGITGTPGTGKKTLAPLVAQALGAGCLGLNDVAREDGLLGKDGGVEPALLRRSLARRLKAPAVVYGHLLPYVLGRNDAASVAVLRCEPSVLKRRLASRGYPSSKVLDNVQAELIGLVSADAISTFGRAKVFEVDTTRSEPQASAAALVALARGRRGRARLVDWMPNYDSSQRLRSLLAPP
ncbi:MAG: AAA family ATPase [Nitrososphaerota archaeon]|nr:AAA family ATPase [Nitrososphaerota archaeon]